MANKVAHSGYNFNFLFIIFFTSVVFNPKWMHGTVFCSVAKFGGMSFQRQNHIVKLHDKTPMGDA